jgi:hypothetical protein
MEKFGTRPINSLQFRGRSLNIDLTSNNQLSAMVRAKIINCEIYKETIDQFQSAVLRRWAVAGMR